MKNLKDRLPKTNLPRKYWSKEEVIFNRLLQVLIPVLDEIENEFATMEEKVKELSEKSNETD